ncbi:Protein crcB [Bacillus cereus AH1272]|nr:Protein crcB [Bacillus cereus AH1272]EEL91217.1 Protein crcB [Bacillus cereus AH1273]
MGAFTTFSTFKLESVQLFKNKKFGILLLYLSATYIIGITFAFLGLKLGGI